jgi:hypothetical protein
MDYSVDVRQDILVSAGGLALLVMLAGFAMPRIVLRPTADWFENLARAPVGQIERAGQQVFPGLRRAPGSLLATGGGAGGGAPPRAAAAEHLSAGPHRVLGNWGAVASAGGGAQWIWLWQTKCLRGRGCWLHQVADQLCHAL